jgi:hypothetical protein
MSDKLGFLDAPGAAEASAAPATPAAPAPFPEPASSGPARDEQGRFASPAAPATPEAAAAATGDPGASTGGPAATPATPVEPGHVPITALLEEREKRQAATAAREALERQLAEIRAAQAPPPELTRDQQLEAALYNQNLRASRRFAEREYGKDTVAQIHDWAAARCDQDPAFNAQMRSSEDPYEAAYQAYNREQILRTVKPADLAAFKAWQSAQAQAGANGGVHPAATANTHQAAPPRSLATASGTGGAGAPHVPVGPGMAFANAITR